MSKMFEGLSIYDFQQQFGDDKSCIDMLCEMKWSKGYSCRSCGYKKYCGTKRYGERRCNKCRKPESATAHTLFHKVKFPIHKAFMMMYLITTTKKGISASELHRKLGLHRRTALLFKRKVMASMSSLYMYRMTGEVEVDETFVGGRDKSSRGRAKGSKSLVAIGIERAGKGISRAHARVIPNAGVKQLKPFFEDHISHQAHITTDGWRSYKSLQMKGWNITQKPSKGGTNFDALHRFIMTMKATIRGIYGSVRDLQAYLDEYVFKFNRHKMQGDIFNVVLMRMTHHRPMTAKEIFRVA